jgi:hypothetical protein
MELRASPFSGRLVQSQWVIGPLIAVATAAVIGLAGIDTLATIVALSWAAVVAYRWPLIIAALAVLLSGDLLNLVSVAVFPTVLLGPGLALTSLDVLVLVSLPFALLRLARRRERPVFAVPMLLLFAATAISVAVGLSLGEANLQGAIALSRNTFYFVMYFVLVGAIDTRGKLEGWIRFVLAIMVIACCLQLAEAAMGHRLSTGLSDAYIYSAGSGGRLSVGGQYDVLYLWNRSTYLSFLGVMLALGVLVESRPLRLRFVLLVGLGMASVALAFVRQWFVYLLVGVMGVILAQRAARVRGVIMAVVVVVLLALTVVAASPFLRASLGPSPVGAWLERASTLVAFSDESNYVARSEAMDSQWQIFLRSPLIGHGETGVLTGAASGGDVGITNTLVETGLMGVLAVVVLWASFLAVAIKARNTVASDAWRGYTIGLIGFWIAVLAGSLYGVNYFSGRQAVWAVLIALALLDRIVAFHSSAREAQSARPQVR